MMLAHQDLQKLCESRDVDVFKLCCSLGKGGLRVYQTCVDASGPRIIKVTHAQNYLGLLRSMVFSILAV